MGGPQFLELLVWAEAAAFVLGAVRVLGFAARMPPQVRPVLREAATVEAEGSLVNGLHLIAGLVALGLLAYLGVALLRPEKFE